MSLIGSLEDLGLGDILQIIHLSQKSGVLSIRGESGEGRIVFQEGLVRMASLKGDPEDLRGLLVDRGFVATEAFEAARNHAHHAGEPLPSVLARQTEVGIERIESLRRECAENAVGMMFSWTTGEFSFDVGSEDEYLECEMALSTGVNAQYLAMESLRVRDEEVRSDPNETPPVPAGESESAGGEPLAVASSAANEEHPGFELPAEEMFGVVDDREPVGEALVEVATANAEAAHEADVIAEIVPEPEAPELEPILDAEPLEPEAAEAIEAIEAAEAAEAAEAEPIEAEPLSADTIESSAETTVPQPSTTAPSAAPSTPRAPVVVIHESLAVLDWVRAALSPSFASVHIFQRSKEGLGRIRQYLARAQAPTLLVDPTIEGSPLSGIADAADFVRRLREQSGRMSILWLASEERAQTPPPVELPVVVHPSESALAEDPVSRDAAAALCRSVIECVDRAAAPAAASSTAAAAPDTSLERLKRATEILSQSSSHGEILPLVLRFASESFSRVAMFVVRGDEVSGIAQLGIEAGGGPNDVEMRAIRFARDEVERFSKVIERVRPSVDPARNEGDQRLAALLGADLGNSAYVAPLQSSDQVVALLYADNGTAPPCVDNSALEVVLHHAGLALDRAALERALVDPEV